MTNRNTVSNLEAKKKLLISIDESVYEQLRLMAFNEHKPMTEIIRELLKKGMKPNTDHKED